MRTVCDVCEAEPTVCCSIAAAHSILYSLCAGYHSVNSVHSTLDTSATLIDHILPILSHPRLYNPIPSHPILTYPILSDPISSYHIISYHVTYRSITSHPIPSYPIPSYLILSHPILFPCYPHRVSTSTRKVPWSPPKTCHLAS
jgi:hypothetical protein